MKEIRNITTTTYDAENSFCVDIVINGKYAEAWIYNKEYGIKSLMFGSEIGTRYVPNYDAFVKMVESNLVDHIECYTDEYMD